MDRVQLGSTTLSVSRLCLGLERIDMRELYPALELAVQRGVTWWDISDVGYLAEVKIALREMNRSRFVLSSHTVARNGPGMSFALSQRLAALEVDALDILFLHDIATPQDLRERMDAREALRVARAEGTVRAMGVHTAEPDVVRAIIPDPSYEVLMFVAAPIGLRGVMDIDPAVALAHDAGRGVVLAGALPPRRMENPQQAAHSVALHPSIHAVRFAPRTARELDVIIQLVEGETVDPRELQILWQRAA